MNPRDIVAIAVVYLLGSVGGFLCCYGLIAAGYLK